MKKYLILLLLAILSGCHVKVGTYGNKDPEQALKELQGDLWLLTQGKEGYPRPDYMPYYDQLAIAVYEKKEKIKALKATLQKDNEED